MRAEFPILPSYAQYLVDTARRVGLSNDGSPIPYSEIESWNEMSNTGLTFWEIETIRELSVIYVVSVREFADNKVQPPFMTEEYRKILAIEHAKRRRESLRNAAKNGHS